MKKSLKMCTDCGVLEFTLILLFVQGVISVWKVEYHQKDICAVKGSSAVIPCSFFYPDKKDTVKKAIWGRDVSQVYAGIFIYMSESDNTSLRYQYIGDKKQNCSFKILQVEPKDEGRYTFRFETKANNWTGTGGPTLRIVDLNISLTNPNGNESVKEGDAVTLTCSNRCDGATFSSALTWFRNGQFIKEGAELYQQNMSSTDSGNYTCSLKGQPGTRSKVMQISVEYSPKNTSVSVRPSAEVDAGSNATLICSSDANPEEGYTWFRKHNNGIVAVGHQPEHHVQEFFQSGDQYFCTATNKHGSQNSSVVTITAKVHLEYYNRNVLIITSCIVTLLIVTTVVLITRVLKKGSTSPETDCEEEPENAIYVNVSMLDKSQSPEGSVYDTELIYATVDFDAKRKADTAQEMDSRDNDGCVIYSTVCRPQLLNSSYI